MFRRGKSPFEEDRMGYDHKNEEEVEETAEDNAEITKEIETLKAELAKRDEQIKESNRNFYGLRKKLKGMEVKSDDKEEQFTDAQLKDMIEEHRDDPNVMLQIMKQVSKKVEVLCLPLQYLKIQKRGNKSSTQ